LKNEGSPVITKDVRGDNAVRLRRLFRFLYRIRWVEEELARMYPVEEELARMYPTDQIKSSSHLSLGRESVSLGFGTFLGQTSRRKPLTPKPIDT